MTRDTTQLTIREQHRRNTLAIQWLGLVKHVSRKVLLSPWRDKLLRVLGINGINSAAHAGLLKAAEKWNTERGVKFQTYAREVIRRWIYTELNNTGLVRVPLYLHCERGKSSPHARKAHLAGCIGAFLNLDVVIKGDFNRKEEDTLQLLEKALSRLGERERIIIQCRYWEGMNLETTGQRVNKSKQRVSQIEQETLRKLRRLIQAG